MSSASTTTQPRLSEQFHRFFKVVPADTPELQEIVYQIRYQVYCLETGFEDPERFPDEMERDEYDAHALHALLCHHPSGEYAGCVRLILDRPGTPRLLFPFERYCGHSLRRNIIDPARLPRGSFGEISRLAVRSHFRRRGNERYDPRGIPQGGRADISQNDHRRGFPHIALGLYLAGAALGLINGLNGVFVMMEPRLARHMRRYGIIFRAAGEVVDYHGLRGPFYMSRDDLYRHMKPEIRDLLDTIVAELDTALQRPQGGCSHP